MTNARKASPAQKAPGSAIGPAWLFEALWPLAWGAVALGAGTASGAVPVPTSPWALAALLCVAVCLATLPLLRVWPGLLVAATMGAACLALGEMLGESLTSALLALAGGHYAYLARRAAAADTPMAQQHSAASTLASASATAARTPAQLDAAFDRLTQMPAEGDVLRELYHLGKAYEHRNAHGQARDVFAHLLAHAPDFRDAKARHQRAERIAQSQSESHVHLQAHGNSGAAPTPTRLGRYEIESELGRGSMGKVYAAHDPVIGRAVALKTLALGSEFDGAALVDAKARFFREAESAGRLHHPQIVSIYDAGDEQGLSWIAMERLHGKDLSHANQPDQLLAMPVVLSIAARVADALDYAHQNQVVHRDIKPSNIVYDAENDSVKVTDFGIARITDNNKTRTGLVLGTPSFMAPEQIAGVRADGRCDVYALGVTLFQLLTGRLPLRADSVSALMHAIAHDVPADVRSLRAEIPVSVAIIVARALHKKPGARFQTGAQMASALREALTELGAPSPALMQSPLDYDAQTDFPDIPMADFPDTVLDTASDLTARQAARVRP